MASNSSERLVDLMTFRVGVRWLRHVRGIGLLLIWCIVIARAAATGITVAMPSYVYWPDGPPNLLESGGRGDTFAPFDANQRTLAIATESYSLEIDVLEACITRFKASVRGGPITHDLADGGKPSTGRLKPSTGRLGWHTDEGWWAVTMAANRDLRPEFFPVRIVESGPVFQHVAVHGLSVSGMAGSFWLEVLAWTDRVRLLLRAEDPEVIGRLRGLGAPAFEGLTAFHLLGPLPVEILEGKAVETVAGWEWRCPSAPPAKAWLESSHPDISVTHNAIDAAFHFVLPSLPRAEDALTPLDSPLHLGRSATYPFRMRNAASTSARLDVCVELPSNVSMTGHSLVILDAEGHSTGVPVQISKNWHRKDLDTFLPYMGTWSHGRFSVTLSPGVDTELTLLLVQGDYGPYHAASMAQLSLIGWGGNGFWIQGALGSWGETVCLQPGRVLRRTYMTDWRPFMSEGINGRRYNWSANAGGADLFVFFDQEGRYVPFVGNRHLMRGYGPCLAEMAFEEATRDGHLAVKGSWFLPQSRDIARVYLQVRLEVSENTPFSRFSLFQAGADYYDPRGDTAIAMGGGSSPDRVVLLPVSRTVEKAAAVSFPLKGAVPWFSFYGQAVDATQRLGQAQRLVVVHAFSARIGGTEVGHPVIGLGHGGDAEAPSYQAEFLAFPEGNILRKGDFVEMTLELVLLPLSASAYYGPCAVTRSLLEAHANSADMASRMVAGHQPRLEGSAFTVRKGPLPYLDWHETQGEMNVSGTSALVPLRIREVPHPGTFQISMAQGSVLLQPAQQWVRDGQGHFEAVVMLDPLQLDGPFRLILDSPSEPLGVASNP